MKKGDRIRIKGDVPSAWFFAVGDEGVIKEVRDDLYFDIYFEKHQRSGVVYSNQLEKVGSSSVSVPADFDWFALNKEFSS